MKKSQYRWIDTGHQCEIGRHKEELLAIMAPARNESPRRRDLLLFCRLAGTTGCTTLPSPDRDLPDSSDLYATQRPSGEILAPPLLNGVSVMRSGLRSPNNGRSTEISSARNVDNIRSIARPIRRIERDVTVQ